MIGKCASYKNHVAKQITSSLTNGLNNFRQIAAISNILQVRQHNVRIPGLPQVVVCPVEVNLERKLGRTTTGSQGIR